MTIICYLVEDPRTNYHATMICVDCIEQPIEVISYPSSWPPDPVIHFPGAEKFIPWQPVQEEVVTELWRIKL